MTNQPQKPKWQNEVSLTFEHLDFDIWASSGAALVLAQEAETGFATSCSMQQSKGVHEGRNLEYVTSNGIAALGSLLSSNTKETNLEK